MTIPARDREQACLGCAVSRAAPFATSHVPRSQHARSPPSRPMRPPPAKGNSQAPGWEGWGGSARPKALRRFNPLRNILVQTQDIPLGIVEPGRLFRPQHADVPFGLEARQVIVGEDDPTALQLGD